MIYPGNSLSNKAKYLFLCSMFLKQGLRQSKILKKKRLIKQEWEQKLRTVKRATAKHTDWHNPQKQILRLPSHDLLAKKHV